MGAVQNSAKRKIAIEYRPGFKLDTSQVDDQRNAKKPRLNRGLFAALTGQQTRNPKAGRRKYPPGMSAYYSGKKPTVKAGKSPAYRNRPE